MYRVQTVKSESWSECEPKVVRSFGIENWYHGQTESRAATATEQF